MGFAGVLITKISSKQLFFNLLNGLKKSAQFDSPHEHVIKT